MTLRFPALVRTTTFRLAMLHAAMFAAFSAGLLIYFYVSTVGYIRAQSNMRLEAEVAALAEAYVRGGLNRLNQSVVERSAARANRFFYLLQGPDGRKISGALSALPAGAPAEGINSVFFEVDMKLPDGSIEVRPAEGRIAALGNGGLLLVAYDVSERGEIVRRITRAVWTGAPFVLVLSLLGGVVISRYAARRADALADTAEEVMAGDLSRRAKVLGSGDEFDRLAERLNAMLERLERLMLSTRHTGDAIAHDLRSPLSRLRNRLEAALAGDADPGAAHAVIGEALTDLDNVLSTFNAILRLSRLEAGEGGRRSRLDVSEIAKEIAEFFEPACEAVDLRFEASIASDLWVLGDRDLLAQALANLMDNAVKYTPEGGLIRLGARRNRAGDIEISVEDTGPGIPEAARADAVRRFVRLEASRSEPGSGLGLALVEAVAEVHSGALELRSGGGEGDRPGLTALLRLPRA